MPKATRDEFWVLTWRVTLAAVILGFIGLALSCLNTDNPQSSEDVYMGYPFFAFIGSRSVVISFPPIPQKITVLWTGLIIDLLIYTIPGLIVSFLVFSLRENVRLVKFMLKSGAVLLIGSFLAFGLLSSANPSPYGSVSPLFLAGSIAFLFALAMAPVVTIIYGYYLLIEKYRKQHQREST